MVALPAVAIGATGFAVGCAAGFLVWRARLCSFGAVEDALIGRDWRRMKIYGLALGVAILLTQALVLAGWFDPGTTTYLPSRFPLLSIVAGAFLFGIGMALVGTCAFGSLVRLGGGDLRSLVVLIVFGAVAYAVLRGVLAPLRIGLFESISVAMPGDRPAALPDLAGMARQSVARGVAAAVLGGVLVWLAFRDRRLRKARRLLAAGFMLGFGVAIGWLVTGVLVDELAGPVRAQSLTFVAPVARSLFGLLIGTGSLGDFGMGSVFGVPAGAFIAARMADEFRWEAFDDDREMRRHLSGAVLMGTGGILAGGCTLGQGLSAGSLLALSWPFAVAAMMLGARVGIAILMGDGLKSLFQRD